MLHYLQSSDGLKKIIPSVDVIKQDLQVREDRITTYFDRMVYSVVEYTPIIVSAVLVLIIGMWLIKRISKIAEKAMVRRDLDVSLRTFLRSLMSIGLKIVLIVTVAGMIGIGTTSFVTILGAAGLAVGLALQGSLSNFAGGVLILIFKPFKVGDSIEAGGQSGEVIEIQIFNTILLTADHKTVILPNGPLSNGTIVNSTRHGDVRLDIVLTLSNDNNLAHVRQIIAEVLNKNEKVLKIPAPAVSVGKVTDGTVIMNVRPYSLPESSADLTSELYGEFKMAFETNEIKLGQTPKKDA
ncbi:mechanosensitive ion channel protein [Sphingobacteriaceae bacterium]|nr:mechanosensitive ion channel protein [Sphingobacteriaceae bacterium]